MTGDLDRDLRRLSSGIPRLTLSHPVPILPVDKGGRVRVDRPSCRETSGRSGRVRHGGSSTTDDLTRRVPSRRRRNICLRAPDPGPCTRKEWTLHHGCPSGRVRHLCFPISTTRSTTTKTTTTETSLRQHGTGSSLTSTGKIHRGKSGFTRQQGGG